MPDIYNELTIGDTMTPITVTLRDATKAVRNLTGWTSVRLFLESQFALDRPAGTAADRALAVNDCTCSLNGATITRASGSFITDGFVAGMLLYTGAVGPATVVPDGASVKTVAALTLTLDDLHKTQAASTTLRPTGWFGIAGQIAAGVTGLVTFVPVGSLLTIGALSYDIYTGKVRGVDGTGLVGWNNAPQGLVQFKAVQP